MGEFFHFVLNFKLKCFRGRKGTIALSSLAGALFYLGLWGLDQNLPHPPDYQPMKIIWIAITSLTLLSCLMIFLNRGSELNQDGKSGSDKRPSESPVNDDTPS